MSKAESPKIPSIEDIQELVNREGENLDTLEKGRAKPPAGETMKERPVGDSTLDEPIPKSGTLDAEEKVRELYKKIGEGFAPQEGKSQEPPLETKEPIDIELLEKARRFNEIAKEIRDARAEGGTINPAREQEGKDLYEELKREFRKKRKKELYPTVKKRIKPELEAHRMKVVGKEGYEIYCERLALANINQENREEAENIALKEKYGSGIDISTVGKRDDRRLLIKRSMENKFVELSNLGISRSFFYWAIKNGYR